ncbi:hypothetical protein ABIF78_007665 [Bradyrhizobium japonicum]
MTITAKELREATARGAVMTGAALLARRKRSNRAMIL